MIRGRRSITSSHTSTSYHITNYKAVCMCLRCFCRMFMWRRWKNARDNTVKTLKFDIGEVGNPGVRTACQSLLLCSTDRPLHERASLFPPGTHTASVAILSISTTCWVILGSSLNCGSCRRLSSMMVVQLGSARSDFTSDWPTWPEAPSTAAENLPI